MALSKIQAESMNLADTFAFTGTVSGAGKILQIQTGTKSGSNATDSSGSFIDSGLSVTITPGSSSLLEIKDDINLVVAPTEPINIITFTFLQFSFK